MREQQDLFSNIHQLHTTKLGLERIQKNLNIGKKDVISYVKNMIQDSNSMIYKKGKNYYCENEKVCITINSYNYCIITAHTK